MVSLCNQRKLNLFVLFYSDKEKNLRTVIKEDSQRRVKVLCLTFFQESKESLGKNLCTKR